MGHDSHGGLIHVNSALAHGSHHTPSLWTIIVTNGQHMGSLTAIGHHMPSLLIIGRSGHDVHLQSIGRNIHRTSVVFTAPVS